MHFSSPGEILLNLRVGMNGALLETDLSHFWSTYASFPISYFKPNPKFKHDETKELLSFVERGEIVVNIAYLNNFALLQTGTNIAQLQLRLSLRGRPQLNCGQQLWRNSRGVLYPHTCRPLWYTFSYSSYLLELNAKEKLSVFKT